MRLNDTIEKANELRQRSVFSILSGHSSVVVMIVAVVLLCLARLYFMAAESIDPHHDRLISLSNKLAIGMPEEEVLSIIESFEYSHDWEIRKDDKNRVIYVVSPNWPLSEGNWIIVLEFSDNQLSRIHFRTADNEFIPKGAPKDIGAQ